MPDPYRQRVWRVVRTYPTALAATCTAIVLMVAADFIEGVLLLLLATIDFVFRRSRGRPEA